MEYDGLITKPELTGDTLEHYGVKGMKWGVRKEPYSATPRSIGSKVENAKREAESARKLAGRYVSAMDKKAKKRQAQADKLTGRKRATAQTRADRAKYEADSARKLANKYTSAMDKKVTKKQAQADIAKQRLENKKNKELSRARSSEAGIAEGRKEFTEYLRDRNEAKNAKLSSKYTQSYINEHKGGNRRNERIQNYQKTTSDYGAAAKRYNQTIRDHYNAKISAIDDPSYKKSSAYKNATSAYRKQKLSDLTSNTGEFYTLTSYARDAEKKRKKG